MVFTMKQGGLIVALLVGLAIPIAAQGGRFAGPRLKAWSGHDQTFLTPDGLEKINFPNAVHVGGQRGHHHHSRTHTARFGPFCTPRGYHHRSRKAAVDQWKVAWFLYGDEAMRRRALSRQTLDSRKLSIEQQSAVLDCLTKSLSDPHPHVRASAVIALAKSPTPCDFNPIRRLMLDSDVRVRESSLLACGLRGGNDAVESLIAIIADAEAAKELMGRMGGEVVGSRSRAIAALSLGLIGSSSRDEELRTKIGNALRSNAIADDRHNPMPAVRECAVLGLGLMKRPADCVFFERRLTVRGSSTRDAAALISSLVRIGDRRSLGPIMQKPHRQGHVSTVLSGLPDLATFRDDDVVEFMMTQASGSHHQRLTPFIALRALSEESMGLALDAIPRSQEPKFEKSRVFHLALRDDSGRSAPRRKDMIQRARCTLADDPVSANKAHAAMILALLQDNESIVDIATWTKKEPDPFERSYGVLALALCGHTESNELINELLFAEGHGDLGGHAALAIGLIAHDEALSTLLRGLERGDWPEHRLGAIVRGLSYLGQTGAIAPLVALIKRGTKVSPRTRAFAAMALGLLSEEGRRGKHLSVFEGSDHYDQSEVLAWLSTIL